MNLWHVTRRENVDAILSDGFEADWGDNGFGVYFFDDVSAAEGYAHDGGWDGSLDPSEAVILEVGTEEAYPIEVDPSWPNPEDYENVYVVFRDEGDPYFRPDKITVLDLEHPPKP